LSVAAGESGVKKVFLRLPAESRLVDAAKGTGFVPYVSECLYGWENRTEAVHREPTSFSARRKQELDDYRLFDLYEACVPTPVRRVEGMSFKEWHEAKDRSTRKEWVFEKKDSFIGWLRVGANGDTGQFELIATEGEELEQMLEYSLASLNGCRHIFCLAPEFQGELIRQLRGYGFGEAKKYSNLIKELTVRAEAPVLVPLGA
jgi:hypothetical protein